jgi:hypothetical protein
VETHVKVLAILYIAFSTLFLLAAMVLILALGGASAIVGTTAPPEDAAVALQILGISGAAISMFLVALALPGLVVGVGMLKRAQWARILGIVLSAINLINIPFGTIMGAYGLWVLLHSDTERFFSQTSAISRV